MVEEKAESGDTNCHELALVAAKRPRRRGRRCYWFASLGTEGGGYRGGRTGFGGLRVNEERSHAGPPTSDWNLDALPALADATGSVKMAAKAS